MRKLSLILLSFFILHSAFALDSLMVDASTRRVQRASLVFPGKTTFTNDGTGLSVTIETGKVIAASMEISGVLTAGQFVVTGPVTLKTNVNILGNVIFSKNVSILYNQTNVGDLVVGGKIIGLSNIYAATFTGSGSGITGNIPANITGNAATASYATNAGSAATSGTATQLVANVIITNPTFAGAVFTGPASTVVYSSNTLASGANSLNPGTNQALNYTGSSTATIAGVSGGSAGRTLTLGFPAGTVIANESGSEATAANRITTGTGSDVTLSYSRSYVCLQYIGTRWEVQSVWGVTNSGGGGSGISSNFNGTVGFPEVYSTNGFFQATSITYNTNYIVARYKANSNATDSARFALNGTSAGVFYITTNNHTAFRVVGTNGLTLPTTANTLLIQGDFTYSAWVLCPVGSLGNWVFSPGAPGAGNTLAMFIRGDADGSLSLYNGSSFISATSVDLRDSTWHHLAIARSGGAVVFYRDGVAIGSGTDATDSDSGNFSPIVGYASEPNNTYQLYIDDLLIWTNALSANQIRGLYQIGADSNIVSQFVTEQITNSIITAVTNFAGGIMVSNALNVGDGWIEPDISTDIPDNFFNLSVDSTSKGVPFIIRNANSYKTEMFFQQEDGAGTWVSRGTYGYDADGHQFQTTTTSFDWAYNQSPDSGDGTGHPRLMRLNVSDGYLYVGGTVSATNCFATWGSNLVAAVSIAATTGWTNTWGKDVTAYVSCTSQTITYNGSTLVSSFTGTLPIRMKPTDKFTGSSLTIKVIP